MPTCADGHENADGQRFCGQCGVPIEPQQGRQRRGQLVREVEAPVADVVNPSVHTDGAVPDDGAVVGIATIRRMWPWLTLHAMETPKVVRTMAIVVAAVLVALAAWAGQIALSADNRPFEAPLCSGGKTGWPCGSPDQDAPTGPAARTTPDEANLSPAVVTRIGTSTSCAALQREFDTAEANSGINRERSIAYMRLADERMREIGCYG